MPNRINTQTDLYKLTQDDIFDDGKNDQSSANAGATITASAAEGQAQTTAAIDGNLASIDTGAEALSLDPAENTGGNAVRAHSSTFLLRWAIKLLQGISGKLPTLVGGKIPVDAGGATAGDIGSAVDVAMKASPQPISTSSLPLPTGAATEANLSSLSGKIPSLIGGRIPVDTEVPTAVEIGAAVDSAVKASAQPISAASLPLPAGAATNVVLQEVRDRLRVSAYSVGTVTTSATGAQYVALEPGSATAITLRNRADTTIEVRRVGGTNTFLVENREDLPLPVLANSNEWEIRRSDASNTQVSIGFLRYTA